jgi:hypothetical protein
MLAVQSAMVVSVPSDAVETGRSLLGASGAPHYQGFVESLFDVDLDCATRWVPAPDSRKSRLNTNQNRGLYGNFSADYYFRRHDVEL